MMAGEVVTKVGTWLSFSFFVLRVQVLLEEGRETERERGEEVDRRREEKKIESLFIRFFLSRRGGNADLCLFLLSLLSFSPEHEE